MTALRIARSLRAASRNLGALSALVLAACSSGGSPSDPDPSGSFTIAIADDQLYPGDQTLWIKPADSQGITLDLTRIGGFLGAVTITVQGLPTGVTAVPLTIPTGASSGLLTLNAAASTALGVTTLTVRAVASGTPERTIPLTITVDPASGPQQFGLIMTPNFLGLERGMSAATTVTVVPGNYTPQITLTAAGLPAGVSASFSPTVVTGGTPSTLTLTAAAGATLGAAVVEIRGTSPGIALQTVNLPIEVVAPGSPPPGGPQSMTWDFCAESGIPIWVAQEGSVNWTQVIGTGDRYQWELNASRGGVAWVVPNGQGGFELNVFYGSQAEVKAFGQERCGGNPGAGKMVTGNIAGLGVGDQTAFLRLGERSPDVPPSSASTGFAFANVRSGTVDLIGGLMPVGLGRTGAPSRLYIQRGLNPAPGALPSAVDFQGANSFAPEVRDLTVQNHNGQAVATVTMLRTANAFGMIAANLSAPNSWYGAPAGRLQAGELHLVSVTAADGSGTRTRTVQEMVSAPRPLTVNFKPEMFTVTASRPTAKHPRLSISLNTFPDYNRYWVADFQQPPNWRAQIQMTFGYRGNSTGSLRFDVPDFDGVTGWNSIWEPQPGPMTVTGTVTGWSGGDGIATPLWVDGNVFWSATNTVPVPDPPMNQP